MPATWSNLALTEAIFNHPQHPYTRGLMNAIPRPGSRGKKMAAIAGTVPSNPGSLPGCPFAPRCELRFERCQQERPGSYLIEAEHQAACFLLDPREARQ